MSRSNTYSTAAADGSADEFDPSPAPHTSKMPAQVAAEKALALSRVQSFIANPAISIISISSDSNSTLVSRLASAKASIATFDVAFQDEEGASK
ncbi:hypothetical protein ONS96_003832 [Cadophora gregata f. sp. sojae]|nr:hypothetical protein ONS96_003832 [Cadophora gregata f. sp. sojae]